MREAVEFTWLATPVLIEKPRRRRDAKFIMLALADVFQPGKDMGEGCFPSIATLAKKTCMSPSHAWRILNQLDKLEYIKIFRGHGGKETQASRYALRWLPFELLV